MIELIRVEQSKDGVFGVLKIDSEVCCVTLERPWLDNKPNISCIPEGVYQCRKVKSPKFGDTVEVLNVPDRTNILFHVGNTINDSLGCILTGKSFGSITKKRGVQSSRDAFVFFMKKLEGVEYFPLHIRNI